MARCGCRCHHPAKAIVSRPCLKYDYVAALTACELCAVLHVGVIRVVPSRVYPKSPRPPKPMPMADGYPYDPSDPSLDDDKS